MTTPLFPRIPGNGARFGAALLVALLAACNRPADPPEAAQVPELPLTREELLTAAFPAEGSDGGAVGVTDGALAGLEEPGGTLIQMAAPWATGVLPDGRAAAAVVVITSGGGTGSFSWVYLMGRTNGVAGVLAGAYLGDRVDVTGLAMHGDTVEVRLVTQGPTDPLCCPTLEVTRRYVPDRGGLREVPAER